MNVLFLSQASAIDDQLSYHRAFLELQRGGVVGRYRNIPFLGMARDCGWSGLWKNVVEHCADFPTDLVFFQFFHGAGIESPVGCVAALRKLKHAPVVAVSSGDLFSGAPLVRRPPKVFVDLAVAADVTFMTCMGSAAGYLKRRGARRITLMPHGYPTDLFPALPPWEMKSAEFDVVMVASRCRALNPFRYTTWGALRRQRIVDLLYRRYGKRFAVFGHGWKGHPAWQGPVEYRRQTEAFRRGRLVVDGPPPFSQTYYASDRPFFVAGAGVPLVQFYTPRFDRIFKPDWHAYYVERDDATAAVCDSVLAMDPALLGPRLEAASRLVLGRHACVHRVSTILSVCAAAARTAPEDAQGPAALRGVSLPFFHDEVDARAERATACVNWGDAI